MDRTGSVDELPERPRTHWPILRDQLPTGTPALDEWILHCLRAIHLKQWERGRTICRELHSRGASEGGAQRAAANGRRWWRNSGALNVAVPILYFDELGIRQLAGCPQLSEPPVRTRIPGWCSRVPSGSPRHPAPIALDAPFVSCPPYRPRSDPEPKWTVVQNRFSDGGARHIGGLGARLRGAPMRTKGPTLGTQKALSVPALHAPKKCTLLSGVDSCKHADSTRRRQGGLVW
jgi:hypothetical protein